MQWESHVPPNPILGGDRLPHHPIQILIPDQVIVKIIMKVIERDTLRRPERRRTEVKITIVGIAIITATSHAGLQIETLPEKDETDL